MKSCILTRKGLITKRWNYKTQKYELCPTEYPIIHINDTCEIKKSTRLIDIMNVVANNKELSTIISIWSDVNDIDGFHEEVNKKGKSANDVAYLEIYRSGQIYKKEISIWTDWHGITKDGGYLGISYVPLYELAKKEVKLNTSFQIFGSNPKKPEIDYICDFTLIEVLHAIYYDISFHGGPKDRDKVLSKITQKF